MVVRMLLVAAATVAAAALGFALESRWALPLLCAVPAYAVMLESLRRGLRGRAIGLMVWWALWMAISAIGLTLLWHARAETVVLNGTEYRDEMFAWLGTGTGRESTPSLFLPQHLLHASIFCALSLATGGAASILMGAVLMNYMSFYVGDLVLRCAGRPSETLAIALAWNPWSMVRVVSFIILGVVLAEPLLKRFVPGGWPPTRGWRTWALLGAGGLLADVLLKALLAPRWPDLLGGCLG